MKSYEYTKDKVHSLAVKILLNRELNDEKNNFDNIFVCDVLMQHINGMADGSSG